MNKKNEYTIPEEVALLMRKAEALKGLRDIYIKIPFGFKKARRCAIDHENYRARFWLKTIELYPELKGRKLSFSISSAFVWIVEGRNQNAVIESTFPDPAVFSPGHCIEIKLS